MKVLIYQLHFKLKWGLDRMAGILLVGHSRQEVALAHLRLLILRHQFRKYQG
jgi:hypothetical protein